LQLKKLEKERDGEMNFDFTLRLILVTFKGC
jgi:hypothetical protein